MKSEYCKTPLDCEDQGIGTFHGVEVDGSNVLGVIH